MNAGGLSRAETRLETGLSRLAEQLTRHGERNRRGIPGVPDVHSHVEGHVGDGDLPRHLEARGGGKTPDRKQDETGRAGEANAAASAMRRAQT